MRRNTAPYLIADRPARGAPFGRKRDQHPGEARIAALVQALVKQLDARIEEVSAAEGELSIAYWVP